MGVFAFPFNEERVRNEGASSFEEFRDWVLEYGDNFLHNLTVGRKGDVLVFGWKLEPGEWMLVGDCIVKDNHQTGKADWCDCSNERGYSRHMVTGGVRLFPTSVSSKKLNIKLGNFAPFTDDEYLELISKTVAHW